jgi:hypothetical protein
VSLVSEHRPLRDRPWRLLLVSVGTTFRTDSWRPLWGTRALKVYPSSTPSMVIRTEYRGMRYSMGSSDPLPAGFEIWFGGLNFQATGNGYLMRLTNCEELRARRQAGSTPVAAARIATTPTPASTDAAGPSAPQRRRRSGLRSRQARSERRHAERVASQQGAPVNTTIAAPTGERSVSGPRFPIGLRGAATAYATNASVSTTMRRVPPGRHVLVARDPSASAGNESSLGSLDALPPATSHGYAEWDFSGVPDPVMLRRFLDATYYWFGYSGDSSAGSYDPPRKCCVVIANDPANATGATGAGVGELPPALGTGPRMAAGPSAPHASPPTGADINVQLAQARELEAKLAEEYRTVWLLRACMAGEASARGERARELGRQASDRITTDFNVDNPETPPRASQKLIAAAMLLRAMPAPRHPRRGTYTVRRRRSSSKRPSSRPRAQRLASASRAAHGMMGARKVPSPRSTRAMRSSPLPTRGARRPRSGSSTHAGRRGTAMPATSSTLGGRAKRRRERQ